MADIEMDPATWKILNRLLDEALDLPTGARARWLNDLPPEHEGLKPRLQALLAHADSEDTPVETLPKLETERSADPLTDDGATPGATGETIGPYRLLRLLGKGGMGAVWLAERADGLFQRPVALKLPRVVWSRPDLASRMAREREILASLNHPSIARLYDAGLAGDGQPYLALEFIQGRPLDDYVRANAVDVRGRLELFLQFARAVAYAHSQLVVHRDIKPSNILVTEERKVHLLDFGIAKLLEDGEAPTSEITRLSGHPLTLPYAAPEQIAGAQIGVGVDVYALGVVLYELLTGTRPYRLSQETRAMLEDAILNVDPPKPSEATRDVSLRKALRGDVDTILLKALKKKPEERYATVDAFVDDVVRYLGGRPVLAQPDSSVYRFRKFVGRNRLAVGAAASLLFVVLVGAGVAIWQARVAVAEKERAEEVKEFIASIFREADPYAAQSGEVPTAVDLLIQAREKIGRNLSASPETRVELLNLVGESLLNLQSNDNAEAVVLQAVEEARSSLPAADRRALYSRALLAQVHRFRGRTDEMRAELATLLPLLRESIGPSAELVAALKQQAHLEIDAGRYEEAESAAREASEMALEVLGPRHTETAATAMVLALSYVYGKKHEMAAEAADVAYRRALESHENNPRHPRVIETRAVLGRALGEAGEPGRAILELSSAIRDASEVFGPSSMMVGFWSQNLVPLLLDTGDVVAALETSDRALSILSEHAQPESFTMAATRAMRGLTLLTARNGPDALDELTQASEIFVTVLEPSHERTLTARAYRALALAYVGRSGEALEDLEPVVQESRSSASGNAAVPLYVLGTVLRLSGEPAEAVTMQLEAQAAIPQGPRKEWQRVLVLTEIGLDQVELERFAEGEASLEQALELFADLQAEVSPHRADALVGLGRARIGLGKNPEALDVLEQSDRFWRAFDANNRWAGEAAFWLSRAYDAVGRSDEGRLTLDRAKSILSRSHLPIDANLFAVAGMTRE